MKLKIYAMMFLVLVSLSYAVDDLYNMTALDNTNNIFEYTLVLNTISNYAIGYGLLIIVFAIAFMVNYGNTGTIWGGLAASSFIGGVSALILLPLGMIPFLYFEYIIVFCAISLILSIWFAKG